MKIRTDFVTNSSSSSFILGFKNEKSIVTEIAENTPYDYVGQLLKDVKEADRMTREEVIEELKEGGRWDVEYELARVLEREGYSYTQAWAYIRTDEGQAKVQKLLDEWVEEKTGDLNGRSVFVEVEYEDHTDIGCDMEHDIMPGHPNTIVRFNNH